MLSYVIRRLLYAVPILIGVNLLTFALFFVVNSPDDMAVKMLGEKNVTPEAIRLWKEERGYDLPLFFNPSEKGLSRLTRTIFYQKGLSLMWFDFGRSDRNNIDIGYEIRRRMWPSLAITVPTFVLGLMVNITIALIFAYMRATVVDYVGVVACVVMMSISTLFYIIAGQFFFGKILRWFPISGYEPGLHAWRFVAMSVLIGVISGIGAGVRFYRTIFLEEMNKDYVRTARAKGVSEPGILFKHVLKNAMIPILTNVVMAIPFLFTGSLLFESFFAVPGLGNFTIEAIQAQDFAIVRSMVYLGSVLYVAGLIATDISYAAVDPRIKLG